MSGKLAELIIDTGDIFGLRDKLSQKKKNIEKMITFIDTYLDEVQGMNDEEFEQFCAEHRDEIAELEKAVEDEIRDYSSFASARELLIVQL